MTSVLRSFWPGASSSKNDDHDDEYSVEYSFAVEYSGPPVSHEIPQVVPVDVRRIPTAAVAAKAVIMSNLAIPVLQPIGRKSDKSGNNSSIERKLSSSSRVGESVRSGGIYSSKLESFSEKEDVLEGRADDAHNVFDESSSSSGTMGFSDGRDDSNQLSGSSDGEEMEEQNKANVSNDDLSETTTCNSIEELEEECEAEASGAASRAPVVTFRDLSLSDSASEESDQDEAAMSPDRPAFVEDVKGLCHRCSRKKRFAEREVCIVCNAKYCSRCVLRAMGSMPEGRKCISCIGHRIYELKRGSLGKCSRMMKKMLTRDAAKQIMSAELSCPVNQLPPNLIYVNDKPLSIEELVTLQSCSNPPKKLRPGRYWYDKVSGFWGKEGEPPCQIISPLLQTGYQIRRDVSNGATNVLINGREITSRELWLLRAAGICCEGEPHFWITADGSCKLEGMNNVIAKLWEKKQAKMLCMALSLPLPSSKANPAGDDSIRDREKAAKRIERSMMNKLLLVGCDQSGTSTIFKQAKILYNVPFSEDEKQNIKNMIQRNLYRYISILLEGREHFREEDAMDLRRRRADKPGPSVVKEESDHVDEKNAYSFSPNLENFSSWLQQITMTGNLDAIFPAATREYSPLVEELWKDKAFQAIYKRRNELPILPGVANYFLDRAVEISRMDYEPSELDILYADGVSSSNGVASMEFSLPKSSQDGYMETLDQNEPPLSYELIRVHASSLGENCKWLEMFEDADLVLFCISLTEYAEYHEDINGTRSNKLLETKQLFERIITHPTLVDKQFLLVLNKFDLLDEMIYETPLSRCEWFQDFNPVMSKHPHNPNSNNNPSLAQRASHYVGVKFKRLFHSLTGRKLFVVQATGLEADSVDKALRYGKEILKWEDERHIISMNQDSSESFDPSSSAYTS
ncbi:Extra-large guanine nucleotide-binding protein 2 [Salvia divinorum]|uniref:Extra-large guanine nucleotide-binding protein 2 n=1 Tax=Salvia divinorum TaxID=28513 RepID=A0ABD1HCP3_SALDI